MAEYRFIDSLIDFLDESPVNFLAARTIVMMLEGAGFTRLDPADKWDLLPGAKHYVVKNSSAVFAFVV
ncbi:MAG: M18 family aminopeptidase, partial [Candidatus Amulumruptor sp.]|nr:M18 family aminopeptidase [Candidatus Amulumruptor sp.]